MTEAPKTGGRRARIKGTNYERELVNLLKTLGIKAQRIPLSGSMAGYSGDVKFIRKTNLYELEYKAECKIRGAPPAVLKWLNQGGGNDVLFFRVSGKTKSYALMDIYVLAELMLGRRIRKKWFTEEHKKLMESDE